MSAGIREDSTKMKAFGSFYAAAEGQHGGGQKQQLEQPQTREHRLSMKLIPMAVRGANKVGSSSWGGGSGAMPAATGGFGSDSSGGEEDSIDEIDTDEGREYEPSQPEIAPSAESISKAARDAVNKSRRANLKLAEAEYRAPEGKEELARARMKAFEILEAANRSSAAVAAAVVVPNALNGKSGAPGQAGSAAGAAASARRVRTGGPGQQRGGKCFPRDHVAPVMTGPWGDTDKGKQGSAAKSGAWSGARAVPAFQRIVTPQGTTSASAPTATVTSPWPATSTTATSMTMPTRRGEVAFPPSAGLIRPLGDDTRRSSRVFADDRGGGSGGSGGGRSKGCSPPSEDDPTRKTRKRGGVPINGPAVAASAATAAPPVSAPAVATMALASMEEDEGDKNNQTPDSTEARSPGSFFPAAEGQQGDGRMQQLVQPQPRKDRIIIKLKPTAVRGTKRVGINSLGGGRGAMPAIPGGEGAGSRQHQKKDMGSSQPTSARHADSISQAARDNVNDSRRANLKPAEAKYRAPEGKDELARARMKALQILEVSNRAPAAVAGAAGARNAANGTSGAPGPAGSAAGATAPAITVRTGGPGQVRGAERFSRDGAARAVTGPRGDMDNGRQGSAATSGAWSGARAAPVFQRIVTPQGTTSAPMATPMSPRPATSTTGVSMTMPVSRGAVAFPPSAGPIRPLGDDTRRSSRHLADDRGGGRGRGGGGRGKGCSPPPQDNTTRTTSKGGVVSTNGPAAAATAATAAPHVSAPVLAAMALAAMEEDEEDENKPMAAAASLSATNGQNGGEMFPVTANPPSTAFAATHGSTSAALEACGDVMDKGDAPQRLWPPPASAQMFPSAKAAAPVIAATSATREPVAPSSFPGMGSGGSFGAGEGETGGLAAAAVLAAVKADGQAGLASSSADTSMTANGSNVGPPIMEKMRAAAATGGRSSWWASPAAWATAQRTGRRPLIPASVKADGDTTSSVKLSAEWPTSGGVPEPSPAEAAKQVDEVTREISGGVTGRIGGIAVDGAAMTATPLMMPAGASATAIAAAQHGTPSAGKGGILVEGLGWRDTSVIEPVSQSVDAVGRDGISMVTPGMGHAGPGKAKREGDSTLGQEPGTDLDQKPAMAAEVTSMTAAAATTAKPATVKGEVNAGSKAALGKGFPKAVQVEPTASGAAAPSTATNQGADTSGTVGAVINDATLQIGGLTDIKKDAKPSPVLGSDISTDGGSGGGGGGDGDDGAAVEPGGAILTSTERAEATQPSPGTGRVGCLSGQGGAVGKVKCGGGLLGGVTDLIDAMESTCVSVPAKSETADPSLGASPAPSETARGGKRPVSAASVEAGGTVDALTHMMESTLLSPAEKFKTAAPSPQAPAAAVVTAGGSEKLISPPPVEADRAPTAAASGAADASESIDPPGNDGISLLLGAMAEVTVEDKEEENGKRKAKKEKNDVKEGKEEDKEEKAQKEGAAAAPHASAARSAATVVKVAEGDHDGEKEEETACSTATAAAATALSGADTPGKAVVGAAPALRSAEAESPAATANIADSAREASTSPSSGQARPTLSPCHPAHAGRKSSPEKMSEEGKSATSSGSDGLLAECPGSREATRLGPIVAASATAKSQSEDTGSCGLVSGLVRVMEPEAENKETREGETKQEERKEDEGNIQCSNDLAPVASTTPTSTASVAPAGASPATAQGESQNNRTRSLTVAHVNTITAAAAPTSVITGHGDILPVNGSDELFNGEAGARDASIAKPSVETAGAIKTGGAVTGVRRGKSGSVREKDGTGAADQGLKEEEEEEQGLEEGEIRLHDKPAAVVPVNPTSKATAAPKAAEPVAALGGGNYGHVDNGLGLSGGFLSVAGAAVAAAAEAAAAAAEAAKNGDAVAEGGGGNSGSARTGALTGDGGVEVRRKMRDATSGRARTGDAVAAVAAPAQTSNAAHGSSAEHLAAQAPLIPATVHGHMTGGGGGGVVDSAGPVMQTPAVMAAAMRASAAEAPATATAVVGGQTFDRANRGHVGAGVASSAAAPVVPDAVATEAAKSESAIAGGGGGDSGSARTGALTGDGGVEVWRKMKDGTSGRASTGAAVVAVAAPAQASNAAPGSSAKQVEAQVHLASATAPGHVTRGEGGGVVDSAGPAKLTPAVTAATTPATAAGGPAVATAMAGGQHAADGNSGHITVGIGLGGATRVGPGAAAAAAAAAKSEGAVAGGGGGSSGSVQAGALTGDGSTEVRRKMRDGASGATSSGAVVAAVAAPARASDAAPRSSATQVAAQAPLVPAAHPGHVTHGGGGGIVDRTGPVMPTPAVTAPAAATPATADGGPAVATAVAGGQHSADGNFPVGIGAMEKDVTLRLLLSNRAVLRQRRQAARKASSRTSPLDPAALTKARSKARADFAQGTRAVRKKTRRDGIGSHAQQQHQRYQRQQRQHYQQRQEVAHKRVRMAIGLWRAKRDAKIAEFRLRVWQEDVTLRLILRDRAILRQRRDAALRASSRRSRLTPTSPAETAAARKRARASFARDVRAARKQRRREGFFSPEQQSHHRLQRLGWEQYQQRQNIAYGHFRMAWTIRSVKQMLKRNAFRERVWTAWVAWIMAEQLRAAFAHAWNGSRRSCRVEGEKDARKAPPGWRGNRPAKRVVRRRTISKRS